MSVERVAVPGVGDRREISVQVHGNGTPVLLIHGIPGSSGSWQRVVPKLVEAGHRVLAPDLLGFGKSSRRQCIRELWIDTQAQALEAVLDTLVGGPALVVGHDFGAPIGVALTSREPARVSGLVLASGNVFTDTPIPFPLRSLRLPLVGSLMARVALSGPALWMMLRFGSGRPRPILDSRVYLGDRRQRAAIRSIFSTALRHLESRYLEVERALPKLEKRVVILWGDRDPFFSLDEGHRAASAIPGAELWVARGAGHFLPAERPDLFLDAVRDISAEPSGSGDQRGA